MASRASARSASSVAGRCTWSFLRQRMRSRGYASHTIVPASLPVVVAVVLGLGIQCGILDASSTTLSNAYLDGLEVENRSAIYSLCSRMHRKRCEACGCAWKAKQIQTGVNRQESSVRLDYAARAETDPVPVQSLSQMIMRHVPRQHALHIAQVLQLTDMPGSSTKHTDSLRAGDLHLDEESSENVDAVEPSTFPEPHAMDDTADTMATTQVNKTANELPYHVPSLLYPRITKQAADHEAFTFPDVVPHERLYRPLLLPAAMTIKENPHVHEYEALVILAWNGGGTLNMATYDVTHNDGQTPWIKPKLHIPDLPLSCKTPYAGMGLSALAFNSRRKEIFLFGFGLHQDCGILQKWSPDSDSRSFTEVYVEGSRLVPHVYHSLTAIDSASSNSTRLVSFGGATCEDGSYVYGLNCSDYSNDVWFVDIPDDMSDENASWFKMTRRTPDEPTPIGRLSPVLMPVDEEVVLVYGGVTNTSADGESGIAPLCDLWELNVRTGEWRFVSWYYDSCRDQSNKFVHPMRPTASYDRDRNSVIVFTQKIAFISDFPVVTHVRVGVFHRITKSWVSATNAVQKNMRIRFQSVYLLELFVWKSRLILIDSRRWRLMELDVTFGRNQSNSINWNLLAPKESQIYWFGGNFGCYTPSPVMHNCPFSSKEHTSCTEHVLLGAFCIRSKLGLAANWMHTPVWIYIDEPKLKIDGYMMKVVYPGPPFHQRMLQIVVKVENVNSSKAIMYGGLSGTGKNITSDIWCFDLKEHYWTKGVVDSRSRVPDRYGIPVSLSAAFAANEDNRFIVYGGVVITSVFPTVINNVLLFEFSDLATCRGAWKSISPVVAGGELPALAGHSVTRFHDAIYIYGGLNLDEHVPQTSPCGVFFQLKLHLTPDKESVSCHPIAQSNPEKYLHSFHTLVPFTNNSLLLLGGIRIRQLISKISDIAVAQLFVFESTSMPMVKNVPFFNQMSILFVQVCGPLGFGGLTLPPIPYIKTPYYNQEQSILTMNILKMNSCPLGYGKLNATHPNSDCLPCSNGSYSATTAVQCTQCPRFQLTDHRKNRRTCYAPDPCSSYDCHQGNCTPLNGSPVCTCHVGYYPYDNCRVPFTYIGAGVGSALFVLLVSLITYKYVKAHRKSKIQEKQISERDLELTNYRKILSELASSQRICASEVKKKLLWRSASCQVWLAKLSDTPVVMKELRHRKVNDGLAMERFQEEAESLRRVHHVNVVMFLGAGSHPKSHSPFIVMEYMKGGCLFNHLHNPDQDIGLDDALRYSLNAASGMKYLHGLDPSRIHCNLKTSNLLLTEQWVVKIADFGMVNLLSGACSENQSNETATLVQTGSAGRLFGRRRGAENVEEGSTLLPVVPEHPSKTASSSKSWENAWSSPESLADGIFNKATDVYRYVCFEVYVWRQGSCTEYDLFLRGLVFDIKLRMLRFCRRLLCIFRWWNMASIMVFFFSCSRHHHWSICDLLRIELC